MLFAAVRRSLLAHSVISLRRKIRSLSAHSGHYSELALNCSVANDPTATFAVHYCNGFDASFSPYQSARLSRYNAAS
jgi:hypothetical protein